MKKIINIVSFFLLSVLLFSCSDIISAKSEKNLNSDKKSLTVNMFMPDYSALAENNARAVSPATSKIRMYILSPSTGKWTYDTKNDILLSEATKTKVIASPDDTFVPGYVYSYTFKDALSEGIWSKGSVRITLLDADGNILTEGYNAEELDLTTSNSVSAPFYTEPYSIQNSNNVFKNSLKSVDIAAGKMDFWYGYFVKDIPYTITISPSGSDWLDIVIFDEKGCFEEYKSVTSSDTSKVTIKPEKDCGKYFGIYNKNNSTIAYTIRTTFEGTISTTDDSNYDNMLSDSSKWTIIDQSKRSRPEIKNDSLYIPMSVTDSKYKTITYEFTINKEMELVYDENTYVCPIYAGKMWIGVDGRGYNPSPDQIVEYITKRIHVYPGKHTFKITGTEKASGQTQYRHIVKNMQLVEIKEHNTINEDWNSGKVDKAIWSFRGRNMPEIVNSIVETRGESEEDKKTTVIFAEDAAYGNFVKLTAEEISTSTQTNVNGSCSLILYGFIPSAKGKLEFDYFEDLGKNDSVTFTITGVDSNGKEVKLLSKAFKNEFTPTKSEGYGLTVYNYKDKTRSWKHYELQNFEAGTEYNIYWEIPKVSSRLNSTEYEFGLTKAFYIDNVKFVAE